MAIAAVMTLSVLAFLLVLWPRPVQRPLMRLSDNLGPEAVAGASTTVAISPDGTRLVFPSRGADGMQRLATRRLDQVQVTTLLGTENSRDPFFSFCAMTIAAWG